MKLQTEKIVEKSISKELVHCKDHKRKWQTSSKTSPNLPKERALEREDVNYQYKKWNRAAATDAAHIRIRDYCEQLYTHDFEI